MTTAPPAHGLAQGDSAQGYVADPRNEGVLVYVNGAFVPRDEARVSVFDSGFVLGDGVWEGLRLVRGTLISLDAHLDRLWEGATSIALDIGMTRAQLVHAVRDTLAQNGMADGAHIRLMVTRGTKRTPNQDPRFAIGGATIVIVAEYKTPKPESKAKGLSLFTSTFRTSGPDVFDLRLNSHSRLNLIQALIQAIHAGADEALMLDPRGFVASCNSTNFFVVRRGELWTSTGAYSFKGITQRNVIDAWTADGRIARECDFTLAQVYAADEAFVTGTLGGVTPVTRVDGRTIGDGAPGPQTRRASELYLRHVLPAETSAPLPPSAPAPAGAR
jgi:branched-chain amino acid aminotransferase